MVEDPGLIRTRDDFARFLGRLARDVIRNPSAAELEAMVESVTSWVVESAGADGEPLVDWALLAQIVAASREGEPTIR